MNNLLVQLRLNEVSIQLMDALTYTQVRDSDRNAVVIYRQSDVAAELVRPREEGWCMQLHVMSTRPEEDVQMRQGPDLTHGATCSLLVVSDHTYFEDVAHESEANAVARMTQHIAQADFTFRSTDIDQDGVPDDVGFVIQEYKIYESYWSDDYRFRHTSLREQRLLEHICQYNYDQYCLAVVFTFRIIGQLLSCLHIRNGS